MPETRFCSAKEASRRYISSSRRVRRKSERAITARRLMDRSAALFRLLFRAERSVGARVRDYGCQREQRAPLSNQRGSSIAAGPLAPPVLLLPEIRSENNTARSSSPMEPRAILLRLAASSRYSCLPGTCAAARVRFADIALPPPHRPPTA